MSNSAQTDVQAGTAGSDRRNAPLSPVVDWVVSLLLALSGAVLLTGGALLYWATDRAAIARWVADGRIVSDVFSDAELVEVTHALGWGGGAAIALTGGLLVVAAVAFHVLESRARHQFEATGEAPPNLVVSAIAGAAVTLVTSFLVLSPLLGGAVAGYLQRRGDDGGVTAGGLAGVFASLPFVVLFAVIGAAVAAGASALVPLVVGVLLVAIVLVVGLSTLGGYLGDQFAAGRL